MNFKKKVSIFFMSLFVLQANLNVCAAASSSSFNKEVAVEQQQATDNQEESKSQQSCAKKQKFIKNPVVVRLFSFVVGAILLKIAHQVAPTNYKNGISDQVKPMALAKNVCCEVGTMTFNILLHELGHAVTASLLHHNPIDMQIGYNQCEFTWDTFDKKPTIQLPGVGFSFLFPGGYTSVFPHAIYSSPKTLAALDAYFIQQEDDEYPQELKDAVKDVVRIALTKKSKKPLEVVNTFTVLFKIFQQGDATLGETIGDCVTFEDVTVFKKLVTAFTIDDRIAYQDLIKDCSVSEQEQITRLLSALTSSDNKAAFEDFKSDLFHSDPEVKSLLVLKSKKKLAAILCAGPVVGLASNVLLRRIQGDSWKKSLIDFHSIMQLVNLYPLMSKRGATDGAQLLLRCFDVSPETVEQLSNLFPMLVMGLGMLLPPSDKVFTVENDDEAWRIRLSHALITAANFCFLGFANFEL